MTRTEHLQFCNICTHQKDGMRKGIICGLTNQIADFEETCSNFEEDAEVVNQQKLKEIENEVINKVAGMGKRFLNYLLDMTFFLIIAFLFYFALGIMLAFVAPNAIEYLGDKRLTYLVSFLISMIYYTSFEAATGRTIAKYITKTQVVTEIGEKPTFKTILIRSLCRFIPFEAFTFLINDGSGLHDTISNTVVINIEE